MFTTAGFSRSAMSANETAPGASTTLGGDVRAGAGAAGGGAETARDGDIDPATMRPTRKATVAVRKTVAMRNRRVMGSLLYEASGIRPQGSGPSQAPTCQ